MGTRDQFDCVLSNADPAAIAVFDGAVSKLLTLSGDPLAEATEATAIDPGFVMAHVLRGLAFILGTEKALLPDARVAVEEARTLVAGANERERRHIAALDKWVHGEFGKALAVWEEILVDYPNDALAMFTAHQADFFLGQSGELRDRVARRLPLVGANPDLLGYYRGMLAFGLEESGDYQAAELAGREAVAQSRRDAWAIHAVAHVLEMTGRFDEGSAWLGERTADWAEDSFFAVHNWWHLALFTLEQGKRDEVLALYDSAIRGGRSTVILDLLDASSLLWRLKLLDIDVGARWRELGEIWSDRVDDAWYVFNDIHAAMALASVEDWLGIDRLLSVLKQTAAQDSDNGRATREVGLPVVNGLVAFARGRYGDAVDLLLPVRAVAARAGGSHAQRDVYAQTLFVAAERAGRSNLARALLNERLALKPHSPINRQWSEQLRRSGSAFAPSVGT